MDPTSPPACMHAALFAKDGKLDYKSIMAGQEQLGLKDGLLTRTRATAITNLGKKTPEALCQVVNSARSGIWNTDGTFNEEVFSQLSKMSVISDSSTPAITFAIFQKFLEEKHGKGYSGVMTYAYGIPITYYQVTDGSVHEMFNVYTDCTCGKEKGITLDRLRRFYIDPAGLTAEVIKEKQQ